MTVPLPNAWQQLLMSWVIGVDPKNGYPMSKDKELRLIYGLRTQHRLKFFNLSPFFSSLSIVKHYRERRKTTLKRTFDKSYVIKILLVVFRATREFFTHMDTSPLPVKAMLGTRGHWASVYNGHLRGPVILTPIAQCLAVELSLPVFTT